jgi:hypothetical protein
MNIQFAQRYVDKYNLPTKRISSEERRTLWAEVANQNASQETRIEHAEAFGDQIANEIAAVVDAAKNNDIPALAELASVVLTRQIVLDVLKENIAAMIMETRQLQPFENPYYLVKRLNKVGIFNQAPSLGAAPLYHVAHQFQTIPILTADNKAQYMYMTRNQHIGQVEERDEAATEIRRSILENRERVFLSLLRGTTATVAAGSTVLVNALPDMALANDAPAPATNVVVDALAGGLSKKNMSDMMLALEIYGYQPKVLYCSARRKADIRNFITTTSTSASPVDFFTQREILTTGRMEGLFGLEIRVLNYLYDDEVYMWDNSADFGEIFLRGGVQVEDRQGPQPFSRELHAAQNEGMTMYNARRIVKLALN